ncbi:MAG TPA: hypothetical protein VNJ08_12260 [Bacteriovoracaceae bacterium]|nr:hypothetical protein [Bacteriovoracaceae bacterium]
MRFLYLCLLLFGACSLNGSHSNPKDNFDKIMAIMKTKSTAELIRYYGQPDEISEPEQDKNVLIFRYKDSRIDAYVDKLNKNKVSHLTIFFFEDFDNYTYLKKRFKNYKWIEEKLTDDKSGHVMTDRYLVKVPELGMQFEYDNDAPKRKVMWIYFD